MKDTTQITEDLRRRADTQTGDIPMHHSKQVAAHLELCIGSPPVFALAPIKHWSSNASKTGGDPMHHSKQAAARLE